MTSDSADRDDGGDSGADRPKPSIDLRLIERREAKSVRSISAFVTTANQLSGAAIAEEYGALLATAPTRTQGYLGTRDTSRRTGSDRRSEELLAHRWWSHKTRLEFGDGKRIQLVDFQFPLKARRAHKKIGKVDLLGVSDGLVCVELKVLRRDGSADNPLAAILEVLSYCAIVSANSSQILTELQTRGINVPRTSTVAGMVLGSTDYWNRWDRSPTCAGWRAAIRHALESIVESTGVVVHLRQFENNEADPLLLSPV